MKKIWACILIGALLVCSAGFIPAQAAGAATSGVCGEKLTWKLENGTLTITGTGEMTAYSPLLPPSGDMIYSTATSDAPWYPSHSAIEAVMIGSGVTAIGNFAFAGCENLRHVTIPDTVNTIGACAFADCVQLTEALIPDGVTVLAHDLFTGCERLVHVTIPDSVTEISECAFSMCCSLEELSIPNSVKTIGDMAFFYVGNVRYTGSASGKPWGGNVNNYTEWPFVFDSAAKKAVLWCSKSVRGNIVIPSGVQKIGTYAFYLCAAIETVTIPDSVIAIESLAFGACTALTQVTFGSGLQSISACAFSGCTNLTHLSIPDSVTLLDSAAFRSCSALTDVTLGKGLTKIKAGTFACCTRLANITIPDSVTLIDESAFEKCTALRHVYFGGTKEQWDAVEIGRFNEDLTNADISYGAKTTLLTKLQMILAKVRAWLMRLYQLIPGLLLPL